MRIPAFMRLVVLIGMLALQTPAWGQWVTQQIRLQPGWNAVYLEVQPEPRDSDTVFAELPVESVWRWNRRFSPVEFIQDPNTLVPPQPDWLVYLPPTHELSSQVNLFTVEGGRPYLIKVLESAGSFDWTVTGKAVVRPIEWLSDSLNFVGVSLPTNGGSTFQAFFSGSAAHVNQPLYRLNAQGYWQQVATPGTTTMRQGEAFWVGCKGRSDYQGPLGLTLAQRGGLDYGRSLVEQRVTIRNTSSGTRTVQLRRMDSGEPPPGVDPGLAGQVPLRYWRFDVVNNVAGWTPFPATLSATLTAGQEWEVRLEVRRPEMLVPLVAGESLYQSVLEIMDTVNAVRFMVPVTAQGMQSSEAIGVHPRAGLWVGSAEIAKVSQPSSTQPDEPVATASPYQFRILVHVDAQGQARLLQKVLQMWQPGTYRTNDSGIKEVDQDGRYVLVTDDQLIPNFTGAALRDGEPVARRFSTTAFGFREPLLMHGVGMFGGNNSLFSCNVILDYDNPLNPFKHTYHPDHDNWDAGYRQKLPQGVESYTVNRTVQLQFTATDPDNLALAGWGDTQVGGIYRETIVGLHKKALNLQGTFRLQHAARVPSLNE